MNHINNMPSARHSLKNGLKNSLLLVLALLLAVLCAVNWLTALDLQQLPANHPLRRLSDHIFGETEEYELRSSGVAAAEPAQLALSYGGQVWGVQYNLNEIDAGMEALRPVWSQVLTGGALEPASEDALLGALQTEDCILLRYHGTVPLGVLADWLGGSWDTALPVGMLLYAAGSNRLFARLGDGTLYAASVTAAADGMAEAQRNFRGLSCRFAGALYPVYPETLLFENETLSLPLLTAAPSNLFQPQGGARLETLLGAFGYTPYTKTYTEQNGQIRVFVDDRSTLRVSASGLVQYAASGQGGTIYAYAEGETAGLSALSAQLDTARGILDAALRAGNTNTHASLYAVSRKQSGRTTLYFLQMYGGVPVLDDYDFAVFVFENGLLASAEIHLQQFQAEQKLCAVMPAMQAAAGADGSSRELIAAFRKQDDQYIPGRFYLYH